MTDTRQRLRHLREEARVSQDELARRVGKDVRWVHYRERGLMSVSVWDAQQIAEALGFTAELLIRPRGEGLAVDFLEVEDGHRRMLEVGDDDSAYPFVLFDVEIRLEHIPADQRAPAVRVRIVVTGCDPRAGRRYRVEAASVQSDAMGQPVWVAFGKEHMPLAALGVALAAYEAGVRAGTMSLEERRAPRSDNEWRGEGNSDG